MIDYLRDRECSSHLMPDVASPTFSNAVLEKRFNRVIEYYNMTLGLFPIYVFRVNGPAETVVCGGHPHYQVDHSGELCSYLLDRKNTMHGKRAKSF